MKGVIILKWLLIVSSGIGLGTLGVWLARLIARRSNFYNNPNPLVPTHKKPVPYLGGAGTFIPFGVLLLVFTNFQMWGFILLSGVFVLLLLGTIDDRWPLPWWVKFLIELVTIGVTLPLLVGIMSVEINLILLVLSVVAILIISNGFNLIDVADGLAGGVGSIVSLGLFVAFLFASPISELAVIPLLLTCVLVGFLIFNRPKATIYLGDGGSLPLGYIVGTLLVIWVLSASLTVTRLIFSFSLVSLIVFEIALICYHRIRRGISIFKGSPDHFALRLIRHGWSVWLVFLVGLLASVFLASSLCLLWLPAFVSWIFLGLLVVFYVASFLLLSKIKVVE